MRYGLGNARTAPAALVSRGTRDAEFQGLAPDPTNEIVVVDVRNRAVRKSNHDLIAVAGDDADVLISRAVLEVTVRLAGFQSSEQEKNRHSSSLKPSARLL